MYRIVTSRLTMLSLMVVASLATIPVSAGRAADEKETAPKLTLASGYSAKGLFPGKDALVLARSLRLTAALDDKGGGGALALDPNTKSFDSFGRATSSTLIAFETVKVTFERVKEDSKDGRRAYEIKGHKFDARLFLVAPPKTSTTYRLVVQSKDGPVVILLEVEEPPAK